MSMVEGEKGGSGKLGASALESLAGEMKVGQIGREMYPEVEAVETCHPSFSSA